MVTSIIVNYYKKKPIYLTSFIFAYKVNIKL